MPTGEAGLLEGKGGMVSGCLELNFFCINFFDSPLSLKWILIIISKLQYINKKLSALR